jgi:hypothetical protein
LVELTWPSVVRREETMKRINRVSLAMLMLLLLASACTSSSGDSPADAVDSNAQETAQSACSGLGQEVCEASDECEPYLAWPKEQACVTGEPDEAPSYVVCGSSAERVCSGNWTWAYSQEDPEDWRLYSGGCVPQGWAKGEGADVVCGAQACEGLPQAECETTYHCFPVFGAPIEDDCTSGESEYAGCWTAQKLEGGEVVAFTCTTAVTWAHPADDPNSWYQFQDSCVPDGWVPVEEDPCESACPEVHPWLTDPQTWECDLPDGMVCSWPAEACVSGQKPDNVCTCVEHNGNMRFECERPFHNCLPLEGSDVPVGTLTRPVPEHRETADACDPEITPRADVVCDNARDGIGDPENECTSDADCEGKWTRCLDSWVGGGDGGTLCMCQTADCLSDADCGSNELCRCGITSEAEADWCGGPLEPGCMHQCIPASCKTDDDCPGNQLCSPSKGMCQWRAESYHCHNPDAAECFSNWECMGEDSWGCNYVDGEGWTCQEIPVCD